MVRNDFTIFVCLYYKLIDFAMLTSPTWTRGRTSSTGNQALELGICSIFDDPSSKEDCLYHLPLRKITPNYFDSPSQNSSHIFGVLPSIA